MWKLKMTRYSECYDNEYDFHICQSSIPFLALEEAQQFVIKTVSDEIVDHIPKDKRKKYVFKNRLLPEWKQSIDTIDLLIAKFMIGKTVYTLFEYEITEI